MNHWRTAILLALGILAVDRTVLAQPGDFNIAGQMQASPGATGADGSRAATMSYERDSDAELLFENALRLLQQGEHAEAVAVLQQALDADARRKVLSGDTYHHQWFYALNLMRSLPAESRVFIERLAGARGEALLERAWRASDMRAVEKVSIQFRYTRAGRNALRRLAATAMDDGDYLRAAACYSRLFEEEADPLAAAAQDPGSLVCWLICEHRLDNEAGVHEIWQRYKPAAGAMLFLAHDQSMSVESWFEQEALLSTSVSAGESELTSLIPADQTEWTYSLSRENDPKRLSQTTLEQLADYGLTGVHRAPALVIGNRVLTTTLEGLTCLDAASGERLWLHELLSTNSTMEYGGVNDDFTLTRYSLGGGLCDQFACDGELVYFLAEDNAIHSANYGTIRRRNRLAACDLDTGEILWEASDVRISEDRRSQVLTQYFLSPPVIEGSTLYVLGQQSFQDAQSAVQLLLLDARTGLLKSAIEVGRTPRALIDDPHRQEFAGRIVPQGELLICATGWGSVAAVDPSVEEVRWAHTFPRLNLSAAPYYSYDIYGFVSSAIGWEWWRGWQGVVLEPAGDLTIFASPETDRLIAYDYRTGEIAWETPRGFGRFVADVLPDRVLVAGSNGIAAFDLATGRTLWNTETPPIVGIGFTAQGVHVASLGGGHCAAIDVADGRILFESRSSAETLSEAVVGRSTVEEPASLVLHEDTLLRVTPSGVSRLQSLSEFSESFALSDQPSAADLLTYARLLEDLGESVRADELLSSLAEGMDEAADTAKSERIALLMRMLSRGETLTHEQDAFLRGSDSRNEYLALLLHRRLEGARQTSDDAAANVVQLTSADAHAMLDDALLLLADSPEGAFFHAPQGRRVRFDRFLQGAILDVLDRVEAPTRTELEQRLATELSAYYDSAPNARELWKRIVRSDRLPWGQTRAVQPSSLTGLISGDLLLREMLLWELSTSADPAISAQAVLRLAELPDSNVDGARELLLSRITPHLELTLDDGRVVRDVIQSAGPETIWPHVLSTAGDSVWPSVTPLVTESRPRDTTLRRVVAVEPTFPAPLERINVEVTPESGTPGTVLFNGVADSFWSAELPADIAPLAQFGADYYYYVAPPEFTRAWNVGPVVYLQVGAALFAFKPFDGVDDRGYPTASTAWPRQLKICSTGAAGIPNTEMTLPGRNGVRDVTTEYTDSFGYRVDNFGPFQASFFCAPETGDLVIRASGTGRELWRVPLVAGSSWLANDDVVIVYDEQSWRFTVHRAIDGEPLATHQLPARPFDVLDASGITLLLELPVANDANATSQLAAWNALEGKIAWSRALDENSMPFLIDQQLVGLVDRGTEMIELIDMHTGEVLCAHSPDQPDSIHDVHCIVDSQQVVVVVSRVPTDQSFLPGSRTISLEGTLHAFDRESMGWLWTTHAKDIHINLDQPRHVPLLVLHGVTNYAADPFGFGEMPELDTKLRFAVIDRRTGEWLVDEMLDFTPNSAKITQLTVLAAADVEDRLVHLWTNAESSFILDYGSAE